MVCAQRLLRGSEGMAASLMLWVAWGLGGAWASFFLRWLQKLWGHAQALQYATFALVPALLCAALLPSEAEPRSSDRGP